MEMDKLLSIIVPAYNMERYLPKCLGSLVVDDATLLARLDVIVVNDGSKDRTSEIAHGFEAGHPGIFRVIDKPNGNYGSCINAALPVAQGTWVKVLDADDWFKTENLPGYLDFLQKVDGDVDVVFSSYTRYDSNGVIVEHSEWPFPCDQAFDFKVFSRKFYNDLTMHAYTYRTEHVRGLGYVQKEGISYSDSEWACIPLLGIKKLAYYPHDVYQYLAGRPGQTMDKDRYAAGFAMVAEVALHTLESAEKLKSMADDCTYDFVRDRIVENLMNVYRIGCFGTNGRKVNLDVADYDRRLKSLSAEYYERAAEAVFSERFRYRFVRGYREGGLLNGFLLWVCRSYPKVMRRLRK